MFTRTRLGIIKAIPYSTAHERYVITLWLRSSALEPHLVFLVTTSELLLDALPAAPPTA